jgi:hypothetical protein
MQYTVSPFAARVVKLAQQFEQEAAEPIPTEFAQDPDNWLIAHYKRETLRIIAGDLNGLLLFNKKGQKLRAEVAAYVGWYEGFRSSALDHYKATTDECEASQMLGRSMGYSRAIRLIKRDVLRGK